MTDQDLKDRSEEVGECWIWKQAVSKGGYPIMKLKGCGCQLVRRVAAKLAGHELAPRQPVATSCSERLCVNPAHCKPSTIRAIAKKAGKAGAWSTPKRSAKIAAAKRAKGKLTAEQAAEIRASTESGPILAARFGIHKSMVNNIKRGDSWRDYTSPFAGLAANDSSRRRA